MKTVEEIGLLLYNLCNDRSNNSELVLSKLSQEIGILSNSISIAVKAYYIYRIGLASLSQEIHNTLHKGDEKHNAAKAFAYQASRFNTSSFPHRMATMMLRHEKWFMQMNISCKTEIWDSSYLTGRFEHKNTTRMKTIKWQLTDQAGVFDYCIKSYMIISSLQPMCDYSLKGFPAELDCNTATPKIFGFMFEWMIKDE